MLLQKKYFPIVVQEAWQGLAKWLIALPLACNQSIYVLKVVHHSFTFNLEPILVLSMYVCTYLIEVLRGLENHAFLFLNSELYFFNRAIIYVFIYYHSLWWALKIMKPFEQSSCMIKHDFEVPYARHHKPLLVRSRSWFDAALD